MLGDRGNASATGTDGFDSNLREAALVLYGVSIAAGLAVDLWLPWLGLHRLSFLGCALVTALCMPIVWRVPWRRLPRALLPAIPVSGLALVA